VITAHPTLKVVAEAQRYGVASIIRKPFAPGLLLERLMGPTLRLHRPAPARAAAPGIPGLQGARSALADFDGEGATWAI
jgi:hypothetical protein